MDTIDVQILGHLQEHGRITNSELARRVGLSAPSVLERVRKLEESGVITGYTALVDSEKVGRGTTCLVALSLSLHQKDRIEVFSSAIEQIPEVLECCHITGEEDYMLRVSVRDMAHYEHLLLSKLTKIPGVSKIKTMVVLSRIKAGGRLEVDPGVVRPGNNSRVRSEAKQEAGPQARRAGQ